MPAYEITFARSARKELERLPEPFQSRIFRRVAALASNPRPAGCRKLVGAEDIWRIRIGVYRVVYVIDEPRRSIDVTIIRHRSEAYR